MIIPKSIESKHPFYIFSISWNETYLSRLLIWWNAIFVECAEGSGTDKTHDSKKISICMILREMFVTFGMFQRSSIGEMSLFAFIEEMPHNFHFRPKPCRSILGFNLSMVSYDLVRKTWMIDAYLNKTSWSSCLMLDIVWFLRLSKAKPWLFCHAPRAM